jgi:hypothetical protein
LELGEHGARRQEAREGEDKTTGHFFLLFLIFLTQEHLF